MGKGMTIDGVFALLKSCAKQKDLHKCIRTHYDVVESGLLGKSLRIANSVVSMYAQCGAFSRAQEVLSELSFQTVVSWNALITGYTQNGQSLEAFDCFDRMQKEGLSPDAVTFSCMLRACGTMRSLDKGEQIHSEIVRLGLLTEDIKLGNALVDMYVKCSALAKAQTVHDELPRRNVVSWSALMSGYAQCRHGEESLSCFKHMQHEGVPPDAFIFTCILKACGSTGAIDKGKQIHYEILRQGLLEKNIVVGAALVDMYVKCGAFSRAQQVIDEFSLRDVVSWGALITGYAQLGLSEEALYCYDRMQRDGLSPNVVTCASILKACGSTGSVDKGRQIHKDIVLQGLLEESTSLGNVIVDMYAKCGALQEAQKVLEKLPNWNVISWSSLIAGYVHQGCSYQALNCFERMLNEEISPDAVALSYILKACGDIASVDRGEHIHDKLVTEGLFGKDIVLDTALVDMYAKCGSLGKAHRVLDELQVHDVVCWSALISGYARQGQIWEALHCIERMQCQGLTPNDVTLTCMLDACSHSGLLHEGLMHFAHMSAKFAVMPNIHHHTCMIDLLGRAGSIEKALAMLKSMLSFDHPLMWSALLGACKKWGKMNFGKLAFDHAIQVNYNDPAAYASMSNIYAAAGMQAG